MAKRTDEERDKKRIHNLRYGVFLAKLYEARKRTDLKQVDVAKALDQPQTFISKVERGERRLDVIDLIDFLKVYGVKPSEFIDDLCHHLGSRKGDDSPTRVLRKRR